MKKYLLFINILLLQIAQTSPAIAQYDQTVANGVVTAPIVLPSCPSTWTIDNTAIGLPASGTGNIPSFTPINTGTTPIIATITVKPNINAYFQCKTGGELDVINTVTGMLSRIGPFNFTSCMALAVSPDQQFVYFQTATQGIVRLNTIDGSFAGNFFGLPLINEFLFSANGALIYMSAFGTSQVYVFSTAIGSVIATINLPTTPPASGNPQTMILSPDQTKLYVTDNASGAVHVINTATNTVTATIPLFPTGAFMQGLAISPDGATLYVTCQGSNQIAVVNTATNALITIIPESIGPSYCLLSADGSRLYVSNSTGNTVSVINTAPNTIIATIPVGMDPFGLSLVPDGSQLYVSNVGSGKVSVINTVTNTLINTISTDGQPAPWGNSFIANPCGPPWTFTITVNPSPAITATAVTGTIKACVGSASVSPNIQTFSVSGSYLTADITATAPAGFEISLTPGSGYGSSVTLTQTAGTVSNIPVYLRSAASAPAGTPTGNVTLTTTGTATKNVAISGTVTAFVTPSVTISTPINGICSGTPATFTAVPVNGGTTPAYQWRLNGSNVGTNSPTFTSATLNNSDQVSCILTSNAACVTGPGTSNTITMTVTPLVTPTITIAASANSICAGTPVTFTATPTGGGTAPTYQWRLNGSNTGTNSPTFTSATLNNSDQVSCILTSNAACATGPATSNTITMTVTPLVTPTITIAASANSICAGVPVMFTATPTGGGTAPTYQWRLNGSNTGTNSATFTSATLNNNDQVSCILTSNAACVTGPGTSNTITMTVTPLVTPTITIAASANSICAGTPVTFTATPTGGGTAPAYQWQLNGSNTGTNSPTFSTTTLNNTDQVSCVFTSNAACATGPGTSNTITMTVTPVVTPSITIAASANAICSGTPATFTVTPTGEGTAPVYQWLLNGSNTGTNSPTFTTSTLNNSNQVSCVLTSNAACATGPATSNKITMTVSPLVTPSIAITTSANTICSGSPVTFTAVPTGGGTAPAYQWLLNGSNAGSNSPTFTASTLNNADQVSCALTSDAACLTTATASSAPVAMNVTQEITPSVTITPAAPEVCAGIPVTFTVTASNAGSSPAYQWMMNGVKEGSNAATYTNKLPRDGDEVVCMVTGNLACSLPGTAGPVKITVDALPTITFPVDPVYKGISGVQLAPSITGLIARYDWSPAEGLSAVDIADPIADPANSQTYQLLVTTDKGCTASEKVTVITRLPLVLANAFTPNGDGHNDVFRIPVGASLTLDQFTVFNRWGTEVFSTRNIATGWDGTYHGQPAAAGTYVYMIKGKDSGGKPLAISGTVMLIR